MPEPEEKENWKTEEEADANTEPPSLTGFVGEEADKGDVTFELLPLDRDLAPMRSTLAKTCMSA
jgi:hypothetical protein